MRIPVSFCNYGNYRKLNTIGDLLDSNSDVFALDYVDGSHGLMRKDELFGKSLKDLFNNIKCAEIYETSLRYQPEWGNMYICERVDEDVIKAGECSPIVCHIPKKNYDLVIETEGKSIGWLHMLADKISQLTEDDIQKQGE